MRKWQVCAESRRLRVEVQRTTDALTLLFQQRQSAFFHGHENTLTVLNQQIDRVFTEKDRAEDALQKHVNEHGCGVAE